MTESDVKPLLGHDRQTTTAVVCGYAWSGDPSRLARTFVLVIDEGAKTVLMSTAANFDTTFGRALDL